MNGKQQIVQWRFRAFLVIGAVALLVAAVSAARVLGERDVRDLNGGRSVAERLRIFDELDFDVFSHQKWDRLLESHADDIVVTWPDGRQTKGLRTHIDDLANFFVFAPDTQISIHPIRFGSGEWTAVTSVMTGTFSRPMPVGDGKTIPPTGKKFSISVATIGQWKNGKMTAEWLFWDNYAFLQQIGLAPQP